MVIKCSASAWLLGVEVDQELHWHNHVQLAIGRGEALLHAANCLTRPSFELPTHHMHHIYKAVVLPKVEYVLLVWYALIQPSASGGQATGAVGHTDS